MALVSRALSGALTAVAGSASSAAASELPGQFAGEALTVALAFCFPAIAAGSVLGLQRLRTRYGGRSLALTAAVVGVLVGAAALVEVPDGLLQEMVRLAGLYR